jgi:hypothetical protein
MKYRESYMSIAQYGLLLDIVAVLILGLESWLKLRAIDSDGSIRIYSRQPSSFGQFLFALGYPLMILGFVLQFIGSSSSRLTIN